MNWPKVRGTIDAMKVVRENGVVTVTVRLDSGFIMELPLKTEFYDSNLPAFALGMEVRMNASRDPEFVRGPLPTVGDDSGRLQ